MLNLIHSSKNTTKKRYFSIFFIAIIAWFLSGIFIKSKLEKNKNAVIPIIETQELSPQNKSTTLKLNGNIEVTNDITVLPEITGIVQSVHVAKGDFVQKDDILISIETNDKPFNMKRAEALFKQKKMEYESIRALNESDYKTEIQVASALTSLKTARLDLERATIDLKHCYVRAQFDGIIDQINAKQGMLINNSTAIARLVQCAGYMINTNIPENSIHDLEKKEVQIKLASFDYALRGFVSGISMKSNNDTHDYNIKIDIPELDGKCINIVGMTADVELQLQTVRNAYHIPSYALSLNDEGMIGIKTLDKNNIIAFYNVDILEEDELGDFWVRIKDKTEQKETITLVTHGHTYVKIGMKVAIQNE